MRSLLLVVAILASLCAGHSVTPRWNELEGYTFKRYMRDFGRNYATGSSEYKRREAIFAARLAEIRKHNADLSQSYKKGVNQFSDWSEQEFKAYNTHRQMPDPMEPQFVHQARDGQSFSDFPRSVDYRRNNAPRVVSDIKNQGACGNCWAHSAAESVETYFSLLTGQLPVLSVQQITSCTVTMDGCGGGDMSYGWMYLMVNSTGLNEEWVYPFVDFFAVNESMQATAPCKNVTKEFLPNFPWYPKAGVTGYARVMSNDGLALVSALATIGPQSISVAASVWMNYEGGIFQNLANGTNPNDWAIDHAVQVVGYGHDFTLAMDYWIVRNSWGTQWGENGYIRLARYPAGEPCGFDPYSGNLVCGTSAILSGPDMPIVTTLEQLNP